VEFKDALTPLERRLVECAAAGEELDCAPTGATAAKLDEIDDWDDRKIRAEVLVKLCTGEVPDWSVHPRWGLRLRGTYIAGQVDLSRAQMTQCPLAFDTCRFEEEVVLYQATTTDLSFTACALPSLTGDELNSCASLRLTETHLCQISLDGASFRGSVELSKVCLINPGEYALSADRMSAGNVYLLGTHIKGKVRLLGATLSGQLSCDEGTTLINTGEDALHAEGMKGEDMEGVLHAEGMSASGVYLRDTHVKGMVNLVDATLSGQLGCFEGTTLINTGGYALNASRMSASSVYLLETRVEGGVRFLGANISGQLGCGKSTMLSNSGGYALSADRMNAGDVYLRDTHVKGGVRLVGANIRDQLGFFERTMLSNSGGHALNADGCQVEGKLVLFLGEAAVGTVSFSNAQIGTLVDDLGSWPGLSDTYNLVGFSYHSLGDEDLDRRLEWISKSKPFSPHVYTQLAEVYRHSGQEGLARHVAIRREKDRGRQPDLSQWVRAWNRFLGLTVAYGYQPWRALVPLVVLFAVGWFLFTRPPAQEIMVHPSPNIKGPINAEACHEPYPCFSPPVYVLDTLLPIVDLHQESNWVPARPRPWGGWYEVLTWVLIASGWILTTAVVAGIGSLWRRE
jgi:hypothetical protein